MIVDMRNATYIEHAVSALTAGKMFPQMTDRCPECEQTVSRFDNIQDHMVFDPKDPDNPDRMVIIIACEGYWMIDPNLVGIVSEGWMSMDELIDVRNAEAFVDSAVADHPSTDPEENARIVAGDGTWGESDDVEGEAADRTAYPDTMPTTWGPWGADGRAGI